MTTLRFRSSDTQLPVALISQLRRITNLSIADIRDRAASGAPLLDITAFENDWQDTRHLLVTIARDIASGTLPLTATEVFDDDESPVTPEGLLGFIQHFRDIELQTQRSTMLELGEIENPSEFTPNDDDWTL